MAKLGWNQRKHHFDRILKKRLKNVNLNWYWRGFIDANGDKKQHPLWMDCICHPEYNSHRTISTDSYNTREKSKYSPNSKVTWREKRPKFNTYGLREKDKVLVRKIIKFELNENN
jgi:hypothetical protein